MKTLIVDDERLARVELRRLLHAHAQIEIIGEASNILDAQALIETLQPELLLLDIQMPGGSGFDLLNNLGKLAQLRALPQVIFTTAYDQYAIQAFEINALDYLLKPIEATRLANALQRLHVPEKSLAATSTPHEHPKNIFIKDGERCWFVELSKIALLESEGNYTRVFFDAQRPLMLRSLNQFEQQLGTSQFIRASRQHIVNLEFVIGMTASETGGLDLMLSTGHLIPMSRRRTAELRSSGKLY